MKERKLSPRIWFNLILFGFMGQIAWNVENMYFNTFLYNSIYNGATQKAVDGSIDVMSAINLMVGFSAATAVITTFLVGTLSDKLGKRKIFISLGYILWGIITGAFGFISRDNVSSVFGLSDEVRILTVAVSLVIILDCLMTFVGSSANDATFNAWVTDVTNSKNRATAESVLSILPIAAMGAVMGLAAVITTFGYAVFFIVLGGVVTLCGVIGIFSIKESGDGVTKDTPFFKELIYGFRPKVVKENNRLYLALCAMCVYSTAVQVFFPYIFIYLSHGFNSDSSNNSSLKITPGLIVIAVIVLIAVVSLIVFMGKLIDKFGKNKFVIVSIIIFIVGLFALGFATSLITFIICALPVGCGYILLLILFNATIRDFTPKDKVGLFQGVRMVFFVLIPMIVGPLIGNLACRVSSITYTNDYGVVTSAPGRVMFTAAAIVGILTIIPLVPLMKKGFQVSEN